MKLSYTVGDVTTALGYTVQACCKLLNDAGARLPEDGTVDLTATVARDVLVQMYAQRAGGREARKLAALLRE